MPPNVARKTQAWFRPHTSGGVVGMACGAALPMLAIIFRLPIDAFGFVALMMGLLVLQRAVERWFELRLWGSRAVVLAALALMTSVFLPLHRIG